MDGKFYLLVNPPRDLQDSIAVVAKILGLEIYQMFLGDPANITEGDLKWAVVVYVADEVTKVTLEARLKGLNFKTPVALYKKPETETEESVEPTEGQ